MIIMCATMSKQLKDHTVGGTRAATAVATETAVEESVVKMAAASVSERSIRASGKRRFTDRGSEWGAQERG